MEDFVETIGARDERRKAELAKQGAASQKPAPTHTWKDSIARGAVMIVGIPVSLGIFLGVIYGIVQFVKWAWSH
jgi:hypothetical protein